MKDFNTMIHEHISDWLQDNEGESFYASDLASECTMGENYDGCWLPYTIDAQHLITDNFDYASDTFNYYKNELDMALNPFESVSTYSFFMLDYGCSALLACSDTINDLWNDDITLDRPTINAILSDIERIEVPHYNF